MTPESRKQVYRKCDMSVDSSCGLPCHDITDDGYCMLQPINERKQAEEILDMYWDDPINVKYECALRAMESYASLRLAEFRAKMPSEEEIKEEYPTDLQEIKKREGFGTMSYDAERVIGHIRARNLAIQEGIRWFRNRMEESK